MLCDDNVLLVEDFEIDTKSIHRLEDDLLNILLKRLKKLSGPLTQD